MRFARLALLASTTLGLACSQDLLFEPSTATLAPVAPPSGGAHSAELTAPAAPSSQVPSVAVTGTGFENGAAVVVNSAPVVTCGDVEAIQGANCQATASVGSGTDPDGDTLSCQSDLPASLPLGPTNYTYTCSDGRQSATCTGTVVVVDQTAPVLGPVAPIKIGCAAVAQTLVPPTASDCSPVTVSGVLVTAEGGETVVKPLVGNVLPAGVFSGMVRWTATDAAGNSAFADVALDASGAVTVAAAQSLIVRDRAQVLDAKGTPSAVSSAGAGGVSVGVQAHVGAIDSVGGVNLQDRAHVFGNITTAGTLSKQNLVVIDGTVIEHGAPVIGASPMVPSVGPVPSTWTAIEPERTITLAAGTHDNLRVSSRATLRLAAGRHVFASLAIEPQAKIVPTEGVADIVVVGDFALRGSVVPPAGSWIALTLLGNGTYTFETNFVGTVIAPNASLALGAGQQLSFAGSYYARTIELRPDVVVRCGR